MKTVLIGLSIIISVIFIVLFLFFWIGKSNADDVREICEIPEGTIVAEVVNAALRLKFSSEAQEALNGGFVYKADGDTDWIPWSESALEDFTNGKIQVGKTSLPPFLRNYCEFSFKEKKVVSKRMFSLD